MHFLDSLNFFSPNGDKLGHVAFCPVCELALGKSTQFGQGWWGDRWKDFKKGAAKVAKDVQSNQAVRDLEKSAVKVGAKTLRGAVGRERWWVWARGTPTSSSWLLAGHSNGKRNSCYRHRWR